MFCTEKSAFSVPDYISIIIDTILTLLRDGGSWFVAEIELI